MTKHPLPVDRQGVIHRFRVGDLKVYINVGLYEDGTPGEIFLTSHKKGSLERGLLNALAVMMSTMLQRGIPVTEIADKLCLMKFDPAGFTGNNMIPSADSVCDYIGKWLLLKFGKGELHDKNTNSQARLLL